MAPRKVATRVYLPMMQPIVDPADFPASRECAYLNTASVALMYKEAETATVEWLRDLADHGTLNFDESAEEHVFAELHAAAARLVNARPEDIAIGSSATELLASVAWAVAPGADTTVVSTDVVFPTTIYPWVRVAQHTKAQIRLAEGTSNYVQPDDLIRLIDDRTAVVCISDVEYSSGQRYDVKQLANVTHDHGALLVVDATQSLGAVPIDVTASGVDVLVASGYKWLCGPFGVAVMYLAPELQSRLDPGVVGFRSHRDMWDLKANRLELPPTARRFEVSTMAYGCAIGLARSIEYLLRIGVERIWEHNLRLADLLIEGLEERGVEIVSPQREKERTSIVAARFSGQTATEVAQHLNSRRVVVSARQGLLRFSPHLYNEPSDIERALEEIDRVRS